MLCFTCKECIEEKEFARHGVSVYKADQVLRMMKSAGFHEIVVTRASDRRREFLCITANKRPLAT